MSPKWTWVAILCGLSLTAFTGCAGGPKASLVSADHMVIPWEGRLTLERMASGMPDMRYYTVSPFDCQPRFVEFTDFLRWSDGLVLRQNIRPHNTPEMHQTFNVPIHLPDGAVIRLLRIWAHHSTTQDPHSLSNGMVLVRKHGERGSWAVGYENDPRPPTLDTRGGDGVQLLQQTGIEHIVSNREESYWFTFNLTGLYATFNGAVIGYTMPEAPR